MDTKDETNNKASGQIDRFKEAARQLEADESEAAFDEKLKSVAGHKPKAEQKPDKT